MFGFRVVNFGEESLECPLYRSSLNKAIAFVNPLNLQHQLPIHIHQSLIILNHSFQTLFELPLIAIIHGLLFHWSCNHRRQMHEVYVGEEEFDEFY